MNCKSATLSHIRPKKSLGQNFLIDQEYQKKIAAKVGLIDEKSIILEIGPGTGNLSMELIKLGTKKIIMIEKDERCTKTLQQKIIPYQASCDCQIINEDFLTFDLNKLSSHDNILVIGNLPYNVSVPILLKLLEHKKMFSKITLMLQKEVADRILSIRDEERIYIKNIDGIEQNDLSMQNLFSKKKYGKLTVIVNLLSIVKKEMDIDMNAFHPRPKVISTLISLIPHDRLEVDLENLQRVLNIFFGYRRKTIHNIFRKYTNVEEQLMNDTLKNFNIDPQSRPEDLYIKDYCNIANSIIFN